jgi:broad specificity phosphatase PhoE
MCRTRGGGAAFRRELTLARHGESVLSARRIANGDPGVPCPLTELGGEQARALGEALAAEPIDLCAVTEFERVRETAEIALAGRDVAFLVVPELNDPRIGDFEGRAAAEYGRWAWSSGPLDAPPAGEHRAELAMRYARGLRKLLERPEATILHVGHSHPTTYLSDALAGLSPRGQIEPVPYAEVRRVGRDELARAVDLLERGPRRLRCSAPPRRGARGWVPSLAS